MSLNPIYDELVDLFGWDPLELIDWANGIIDDLLFYRARDV